MRISIRNNAQLPKKYLRFIKRKFFKIKQKFNHLIYVEIFLDSEGQSPKTYTSNIRLGIPGNDIIIQSKSENVRQLFQKASQAVPRYLAKSKTLKKKNTNEIFYKEADKT